MNILLIEDDDICVEAVRRAFRKLGLVKQLTVANDGQEALNMLRGVDGAKPPPKPFLILLDLNMPRMNGFEFLDELRGDESIRHSVVFVLTTSNHPSDKLKAYDRYIAGYLIKSLMGSNFQHLFELLDVYQKRVELPTHI